MGRPKGSGSIYYLPGRDLWRAVVELPSDGRRRQWTTHGKDRDTVEAKLQAKFVEVYGGLPNTEPATLRSARLRVARLNHGGHTADDRRTLLRHAPRTCKYCRVDLDYRNRVIDHVVPVAKGGRDTLDNLQVICWQCNAEKGDLDEEHFSWEGAGPRPYRPLPRAREVVIPDNAPCYRGWGLV